MNAELQAAVDAAVKAAPPLTPEQRDYLALILGGAK
jgi:hypothetical protein